MFLRISPFIIAAFLHLSTAIQQEEWQPFQPISQREINYGSITSQEYQQAPSGGQCEIYKVGFTQDLYFQYVQYKTDIPDMKEFTLCFWSKFTNHSNDHPLFSYAGKSSRLTLMEVFRKLIMRPYLPSVKNYHSS